MSTKNFSAKFREFNISYLPLMLVALVWITPGNFAVAQDAKIDFAKSIKPILENHCLSCHGPEEAEAFRVDVKDEIMDYIEAESADDSQLYQSLISDDEEELMPPADEENPLSNEEIESVKTWIDQGAEWPDGVKLVLVSTEAEQVHEDDEHNEAPVDPNTQRIFNAFGSLHPAAVHLPVGLLLASGLFALFSLRGNFVMSDCAYYCLWLGTLGSIIACLTGWWFSPMEGKGTVAVFDDLLNQAQPVFWHRTSALILTIVALLLALFAAGARNRDPDDGIMWKLGLILLACGVGWVGHEGGELTHGKQHYKDLNELGQQYLPQVFGEPDIVEPINKKKDDDSDDVDAESEVGKSSDET